MPVTITPCGKKSKESGARRAVLAAVAAAVILVSPVAAAAFDPPMASLPTQSERSAVSRALQDMKQERWSAAHAEISKTAHPLSRKIYDWMYLRAGRGNPSFYVFENFIAANPDWPNQKDLRAAAEKAISGDIKPGELVAWFSKYPPLTYEGMDAYLTALLALDSTTKMHEVLNGWWPDAQLDPTQQKTMLERYGAIIDRKTQERRLDRLLLASKYTNARAIAKRLGKGYPELAEARIGLAEQSPGVNRLIAAVPAALKSDAGLAYERLRWRRRNDLDFEAMEILHHQPSAGSISNPEDWWSERQTIARRLIDRGQYESAYLLVKDHELKDGAPFAEAEWLAGWLALKKLGKPGPAFEHFEALYHNVTSPISRARGAYWAGLASKSLGYPEVADQWFQAAATHPETFYGQMSLGALSPHAAAPAVPSPPAPDINAQQAFNRLELAQAARLLHDAGRYKEASAFIAALGAQAQKPEDYKLVADLAFDLDQYQDSVRVAKDAARKGVMLTDQAYPTMLARMKGVDVEWALVHALIRQESAFDYAAQSSAGALGLMQLMPGTASDVARKEGISHKTEWLLTRPDHNIRLGADYIGQMVDRFDGSYLLALAAYNAGPARVAQWIGRYGDPRNPSVDAVDWIEMIPFSETRNYVQRVLEGVYVYRVKFKDIQKQAQSPIHVAINR